MDGSGETQRLGVGDAVAWTRLLKHGGAESATPARTEGLRGAEGPFAGPPPRLVRELRRVRIAALHRKGVRGGQRVCVWGCVTAGRGLRAATPYPSGGAGAEPRQGARPATVYWGPCARRPRASVPALLGSPPETGG